MFKKQSEIHVNHGFQIVFIYIGYYIREIFMGYLTLFSNYRAVPVFGISVATPDVFMTTTVPPMFGGRFHHRPGFFAPPPFMPFGGVSASLNMPVGNGNLNISVGAPSIYMGSPFLTTYARPAYIAAPIDFGYPRSYGGFGGYSGLLGGMGAMDAALSHVLNNNYNTNNFTTNYNSPNMARNYNQINFGALTAPNYQQPQSLEQLLKKWNIPANNGTPVGQTQPIIPTQPKAVPTQQSGGATQPKAVPAQQATPTTPPAGTPSQATPAPEGQSAKPAQAATPTTTSQASGGTTEAKPALIKLEKLTTVHAIERKGDKFYKEINTISNKIRAEKSGPREIAAFMALQMTYQKDLCLLDPRRAPIGMEKKDIKVIKPGTEEYTAQIDKLNKDLQDIANKIAEAKAAYKMTEDTTKEKIDPAKFKRYVEEVRTKMSKKADKPEELKDLQVEIREHIGDYDFTDGQLKTLQGLIKELSPEKS